MTYSMIIEKYQADAEYIFQLKTWNDVVNTLKNGLNGWVIRVMITKYGKDYRVLGGVSVTMHNFYRVVNAKTDKEAFS